MAVVAIPAQVQREPGQPSETLQAKMAEPVQLPAQRPADPQRTERVRLAAALEVEYQPAERPLNQAQDPENTITDKRSKPARVHRMEQADQTRRLTLSK